MILSFLVYFKNNDPFPCLGNILTLTPRDMLKTAILKGIMQRQTQDSKIGVHQ